MTTLTVLVIIGLLATVGALITGIASMAHGGEFDRRHGYQFMFARVGLQGITLVVLLIALFLATR
jgi:hypothetical protein